MSQYREIEIGTGHYPFNPQANYFEVQKKQKRSNVTRYQLPRTVIAQVKSTGCHYIYGPSRYYDTTFPVSLNGKITKEEFNEFITQVNTQINKYWPCEFTFILAYACSLLTLFISLKLPESCMDEVQKFLGYVLERWNETWNERGIYIEYKRWLCSSMIEFSIQEEQFQYSEDEKTQDKDLENPEDQDEQMPQQNQLSQVNQEEIKEQNIVKIQRKESS